MDRSGDCKRCLCGASVVALSRDGDDCGADVDVVAIGGREVRSAFKRFTVERYRRDRGELRASVCLRSNADLCLGNACRRDGERPAGGAGVVTLAGHGCLGGARMLIVGI